MLKVNMFNVDLELCVYLEDDTRLTRCTVNEVHVH